MNIEFLCITFSNKPWKAMNGFKFNGNLIQDLINIIRRFKKIEIFNLYLTVREIDQKEVNEI